MIGNLLIASNTTSTAARQGPGGLPEITRVLLDIVNYLSTALAQTLVCGDDGLPLQVGSLHMLTAKGMIVLLGCISVAFVTVVCSLSDAGTPQFPLPASVVVISQRQVLRCRSYFPHN